MTKTKSVDSPIEASGETETHLIERKEGAWAELLPGYPETVTEEASPRETAAGTRRREKLRGFTVATFIEEEDIVTDEKSGLVTGSGGRNVERRVREEWRM